MGFFHILRFSEKGFVLFQACSLNLTYIPDDFHFDASETYL